METFIGIMIPFLGTTLGAACVFFMKKSFGDLVQRSLAGFAAGVMVAASIWSLLIPAIEQSEGMGKLSFFPAFIGFWVGVLFLLLLDHLIPHLHVGSNQAEGPKSRLGRTTMMVLAVTLHNIPEGMAVGVMYAGFLAGNAQITAASALVLSLGIAIQNFPEGGDHLHAATGGGREQGQGISRRRAFRRCRAYRRGADASRGAAGDPGAAVFSELCGGRHALCGCGGADSRNVTGKALQPRNGVLCRRLQRDDDAGCGAGIGAEVLAFFASGVFYYFLTEQVKALVQGMADAFPGGVLVFDAANRAAVKMIAKTWLKSAKIKDVGAYFAVSDAPQEISAWDSRLQVTSRGYMLGYNDLKDPSVSRFFRFLAKVGDGMMKMQIVRIKFGGR